MDEMTIDNITYCDNDLDGTYETACIDADADGFTDAYAFDEDGNGTFEVIYGDVNSDGIADSMAYDSDDNGLYDVLVSDLNQNGVDDSLEVETVLDDATNQVALEIQAEIDELEATPLDPFDPNAAQTRAMELAALNEMLEQVTALGGVGGDEVSVSGWKGP